MKTLKESLLDDIDDQINMDEIHDINTISEFLDKFNMKKSNRIIYQITYDKMDDLCEYLFDLSTEELTPAQYSKASDLLYRTNLEKLNPEMKDVDIFIIRVINDLIYRNRGYFCKDIDLNPTESFEIETTRGLATNIYRNDMLFVDKKINPRLLNLILEFKLVPEHGETLLKSKGHILNLHNNGGYGWLNLWIGWIPYNWSKDDKKIVELILKKLFEYK